VGVLPAPRRTLPIFAKELYTWLISCGRSPKIRYCWKHCAARCPSSTQQIAALVRVVHSTIPAMSLISKIINNLRRSNRLNDRFAFICALCKEHPFVTRQGSRERERQRAANSSCRQGCYQRTPQIEGIRPSALLATVGIPPTPRQSKAPLAYKAPAADIPGPPEFGAFGAAQYRQRRDRKSSSA